MKKTEESVKLAHHIISLRNSGYDLGSFVEKGLIEEAEKILGYKHCANCFYFDNRRRICGWFWCFGQMPVVINDKTVEVWAQIPEEKIYEERKCGAWKGK